MLTVLARHGKTPQGQYTYRCVCECGNESIARTGCLRNGHTKSCGCKARYSGPNRGNYKHGLSDKSHPENKRYQRECFDRFKYGLEPEQKQAMLESQNGGCAICGYKFGQKIGEWDKVAIQWGYQDFPAGIDETKALDKLMTDALKKGSRHRLS